MPVTILDSISSIKGLHSWLIVDTFTLAEVPSQPAYRISPAFDPRPQPPMALASGDYATVLASLIPPACKHHVLSLPVSPRKPHISSHIISSLSLHPVLEAALHILNLDLPAAHFLLRHMQAAPAWEAMYLHGILHRFEGDLDNTRAWYGDVEESEVFQWVWDGMHVEDSKITPRGGGQSKSPTAPTAAFELAMSFIDRVEAYKRSPTLSRFKSNEESPSKGVSVEQSLADVSLREMRRVLSFCELKYGTSAVVDASQFWVSMNQKHAEKAGQMIIGGEGWREF